MMTTGEMSWSFQYLSLSKWCANLFQSANIDFEAALKLRNTSIVPKYFPILKFVHLVFLISIRLF